MYPVSQRPRLVVERNTDIEGPNDPTNPDPRVDLATKSQTLMPTSPKYSILLTIRINSLPQFRLRNKPCIFLGLDRETCQHSRCPLLSIRPVPDPRRYSGRDGPPSWNSRKRGVQESDLAVRSNTSRPGRLRWIRGLPTIRNTTATDQRTLLGGLHGRVPSSSR